MAAVAPWEGGHRGAAAAAIVVGICMVFVCVVGCELCVGGTCNFTDLQLTPLWREKFYRSIQHTT